MEGVTSDLSAGDVTPYSCLSKDSCKEGGPGGRGEAMFKGKATLKGEASEFVSRLWRLVEEGDRFTDVKVIFKDGQQIGAHSVVLAALSPFFQAMLSTEMREKSRGVIKLPTISHSTFQSALQWSFGQEVRVRVGRSLRDLLEAADMMQLWTLAGACVGVLVSKLTPDSCLDILNLVYRFKMSQVREHVEVFVAKYLGRACLSQEWVGLSQDEVASLVGIATREGAKADIVADAVLKWLGANCPDPPDAIRLLSLVQVEQLSSPFLCDTLMFHPSVVACPDFAVTVKRNIRSRLTSSGGTLQIKDFSTPPGDRRRSSQTAHYRHSQLPLASATMPLVSTSPPMGERAREQAELTSLPALSRDVLQVQNESPSGHSIRPLPSTIASYRGEEMSEGELESGVEDEIEEENEEVPIMRTGMLLVGGAGFEGRTFFKAWLQEEEHWINLADGCCMWVTGGRGSRKKSAMLDLRSNAWHSGPDLNVGRYAHAMAATRDSLFVVGGCAGFSLKSIERRIGSTPWQEWGNLQVPVQDCGVGVAGDLLVVLGGEGLERQFCFLQTVNLRTRAACIARSRLPVMTSAVRCAGSRVLEGGTVLCFVGGDGHVVFVTDVRDNVRVTDHLQLEEFGPKVIDFGAVLDDDVLMVCGGFRNGAYNSDVRAFNMRGRRINAQAFRHLPANTDVRAIFKAELPFLPYQ